MFMSNSNSLSGNMAVLRKPIAMTHMRNNWSLRQLRMSNLALYKSQKSGYARKGYRLSEKDIERYVKLGKTRNKEWKDKFLNDFFMPIKLNEFAKDRNVEVNYAVPLFDAAAFVGNDFYYEINEKALPYIQDAVDGLFLDMTLAVQTQLHSAAAQALYEYFKAELATAGVKRKKIQMKLGEIRKKAGTNNGKHKNVAVLNRDVIKPVLENINEKSDICVNEAVPLKSGRKYTGFEFDVKEKRNFTFKAVEFTEEDDEIEACEGLTNFLKGLGVAEQRAKTIALDYPAERIARNVEHAQKQKEEGNIKKSYCGYVIKAIEGDYAKDNRLDVQPDLLDLEDNGVAERDCKKADEEQELRKKFEDFHNEVIDEYLAGQPDEWVNELRSQLKEEYSGNKLFEKSFKDKEWSGPYARSVFRNAVQEKAFTQPHHRDFEAYKVWKEEGGDLDQ